MEIYKSVEKRKIDDILNILVDNLKIFIVLETCPTLIYKVADNCKCKFQVQEARVYKVYG